MKKKQGKSTSFDKFSGNAVKRSSTSGKAFVLGGGEVVLQLVPAAAVRGAAELQWSNATCRAAVLRADQG